MFFCKFYDLFLPLSLIFLFLSAYCLLDTEGYQGEMSEEDAGILSKEGVNEWQPWTRLEWQPLLFNGKSEGCGDAT